MAGNKNSGRRVLGDRQKRQVVIDKAWVLLEKYIDDETVAIKERVEIAKAIVVKSIPQEVTGEDGNPLLPINIIFESTKKEDSNAEGCLSENRISSGSLQ